MSTESHSEPEQRAPLPPRANAESLTRRREDGLAGVMFKIRRGFASLFAKPVAGMHVVGDAVRSFFRPSRFPWLARVNRRIKERSRFDALGRDYRNFLATAHQRVVDGWRERLFFAPTVGRTALRQLHVRSINRIAGSDYKPTPRLVFDWALEAIDENLRDFAFVDYGAGRGRVLLLAAERPFLKVRGVEFAEELHNDAVMNIAQYPRSRMKCRDVECTLDDAVRYDPPDEKAVLYFFNPFGPRVFADALSRIVESYRANPRRMYLILVDPLLADSVDETQIFQPVPLPKTTQAKIGLFSPYEIAVYRSLA